MFWLLERKERHDRQQEYRLGTVAAAIYNVHRDRKKHPDPLTWQDIFPDPTQPPKRPTWEEILQKVVVINAALGGRDERGRKP